MEARQRVMEAALKHERKTTNTNDIIEYEALMCYRYSKVIGEIVDDTFLSAKIEAFKVLCLKEGDYKLKEEE